MYTFTGKVRYSELDRHGKLSVASIVNYFQDCSTYQSEALGVGLEHLKETGRIWMLAHWFIRLEGEAHLGDELTIGTWAYGFDHTFGYRNFMIKNGDRYIAKASSKWLIFDAAAGRPSRITQEDAKAYGEEPQMEIAGSDHKVLPPKDYQEFPPFPVRRSDLDTNGHVNNEKYIAMAADYLIDEHNIQQILVEYRQQAMLGDQMIPCLTREEDRCVVMLKSADNRKAFAIVEFQF